MFLDRTALIMANMKIPVAWDVALRGEAKYKA
jgi:hypothetical protein